MLTIKKSFPTREMYLVTGIIVSVAIAGALAAIVSAHSLKDQSAVLPTKVVKTNDESKKEPGPQKAAEAPVKEYTGTTSPRVVNNAPVATTAPIATSTPTVSPVPTPSETPTPSPEPSPASEPSPEPSPES